jgi:hypothetical protein
MSDESSEQIIVLNLGAIARTRLFGTARTLLDSEENYGPALAVVVAQTAVELAFETAIDFSLQARDVPGPVQEWIAQRSTIDSWSPTNRRVQRLWAAVTGDVITQADRWEDYKVGTNLRHGVVHRARSVTLREADDFIEAAESIVNHVLLVMHRMGEELRAEDQ